MGLLKSFLSGIDSSSSSNTDLRQDSLFAVVQFAETREGKVDQAIPPGEAGRVFYNGTFWKARMKGRQTASTGQKVRVITNLTATTLLVEPQ